MPDAPRIELPGGMQAALPTPEQEALRAVHQQLQQITIVLNTIAGQLDTALRLGSGQMSKHEVKVKYQEFDAKMRAAQRAQAEPHDEALD